MVSKLTISVIKIILSPYFSTISSQHCNTSVQFVHSHYANTTQNIRTSSPCTCCYSVHKCLRRKRIHAGRWNWHVWDANRWPETRSLATSLILRLTVGGREEELDQSFDGENVFVSHLLWSQMFNEQNIDLFPQEII